MTVSQSQNSGRRARLTRVTISVVLAGIAVAELTTVSYGSEVRRVELDIPSSTVSEELRALYQATGAQIIFQDRWHMPARGVKGRYTVEEALIRILDHTRLVCEYIEGGALVIRFSQTQRLRGKCLHREPPPTEIQRTTPAPQNEMEEVDVFGRRTGTRIVDLEQVGSPLLNFNAQQIRHSGAQTLPGLLNDTTQNFGGGPTQQTHFGQPETLTNSFQGVSPNLRGIDSGATMVLLNGHPLAPSGTEAAVVDLLQIPLSAIDHVDVLLDGASAFYGSDAVAGVINIHTQRDYSGPNTLVQVGGVTDGRQEHQRLSQELGHRWDTGSILVVVENMHQGALAANERWQNSSNRIPGNPATSPFYYTNPGNLLEFNGPSATTNYAIPRQVPGSTLDLATLNAGPLNRSNSYNDSDIVPDQTLWSTLTALQQKLGDEATLFSDVLWSQRRAVRSLGGQEVTLDVTHSPYLLNPPSSGTVLEEYNLLDDLGPEITRVNVHTLNATLGVQVNLPSQWHMVVSGTDALESENEVSYNAASPGALQLATYNPSWQTSSPSPDAIFDPFGSGSNMTPAVAKAVETQPWYGSRSQLWDFSVTAGGPMGSLPAGPLKQTIGFEYRDQRFSSGVSETASFSDLRRQRYAGYLELAAPLLDNHSYPAPLRSLMLSLAGRIENYSDFGTSFAPRIGLTWEPVQHLALSSTWSHSVRAPNMEDLVTRDNTSLIRVLGSTPALVWSGGNADLHEEKASTRTLGLSFKSDDEDLPLFTAAISYFDILFRDRIQQSDFPTDILTNPAYSSVVTLNPSRSAITQVCAQSQYLSTDGSECTAAQVGAIVDLRTQNAGRLWTDGIDTQLGTHFSTSVGKLGFGLKSTYIFDYQEAALPDAPMVSLLDTLSNPLAWHLIGTGTWTVGPAQASFTIRHTKGYRNTEVEPFQRVASWTTGDVRLSYTFNVVDRFGAQPVEVALNLENVTNHYSPFVINTVANLAYDQENGSLQGRMVTLDAYLKY